MRQQREIIQLTNLYFLQANSSTETLAATVPLEAMILCNKYSRIAKLIDKRNCITPRSNNKTAEPILNFLISQEVSKIK